MDQEKTNPGRPSAADELAATAELAARLQELNAQLHREVAERKQAEQALKHSEEHFRSLFENSMDIIAIFDAAGNILDMSPSVFRHLGRTADDIKEDNIFDVVHPDDVNRLIAAHEHAVTGRAGQAVVSCRFKHEDGSWHDFEAAGTAFMDEAGEMRVVVNARDVTDRNRAAQALREREEYFRLLLENALDMIAATDTEGVLTYVSPSSKRILGYTPEEMLGRNSFEFIHPDDLDAIVQVHLAALREPGSSHMRTFRMPHKDGGWRYMEAIGRAMVQDGVITGMVINGRDVTERKQAEEALRRSEERFRTLIENASDIIVVVSAEGGQMTYASPSVATELGYPLEEFVGRPGFEMVHPDDLAIVLAANQAIVEHPEQSQFITYRMRHHNGSWRWVEVTARAIVEDGAIVSIVLNGRDITMRRRTEEELIVLNRELEGYAQTVSHDLRTPLTSIKLANETLQKVWASRESVTDDELDEDVVRFSQVIHDSTRRAEALTSDLLSLARAGLASEEVEMIDLAAVVEEILEDYAGAIEEKGVAVTVDASLGSVRGNPIHIYQVFSNLISNAVRHNTSEHPWLEVRRVGEQDGQVHSFLVCDNGPGVPEADRENVFLPFFKGKRGDTGIGLAIADKIVRLYGGSIREYNHGGACFEFNLRDWPTD